MPALNDSLFLRECEVGGEYMNKHGKRIQIVGVGESSVRVLVLATNMQIELPKEYRVYPILPKDEIKVRAKDVISTNKDDDEKPTKNVDKKLTKKAPMKPTNKSKTKKEEKPKVEKIKPSTVKVSDRKKIGGSRIMKKDTAKRLVLNLLQKGPCTRDELAKAVITKGLSANKDIKKVKKMISVMLSVMKKRDKVNIVSVEPGKYVLKD